MGSGSGSGSGLGLGLGLLSSLVVVVCVGRRGGGEEERESGRSCSSIDMFLLTVQELHSFLLFLTISFCFVSTLCW